MISLMGCGRLETAVENRLDAEEHLLRDQRLEVSSSRDSEIRHVDAADVDVVSQDRIERLRRHRLPTSGLQAQRDHVPPDFALGEASGCEVLKRAFDQRCSRRIGNQALT